jgi:hypothetical protein
LPQQNIYPFNVFTLLKEFSNMRGGYEAPAGPGPDPNVNAMIPPMSPTPALELLRGTKTWTIASFVFLVLSIGLAVATIFLDEVEVETKIIRAVLYLFMMMSTFWLSATVRDWQRRQVFRAVPQLAAQYNLLSETNLKVRLALSFLGMAIAIVLFIVSNAVIPTQNILSNCLSYLLLFASVAVFTKTHQDKFDAKNLEGFYNQ